MDIKITIPDAKLNGIINAFCDMYGYQAKIQTETGEIDNPITKAQFCKSKINDYIKEVFVNNKINSLETQKSSIRESATIEVKDITTS